MGILGLGCVGRGGACELLGVDGWNREIFPIFVKYKTLHLFMNAPNYNSLAFFRSYYHIPKHWRLSWALIVETVHGEETVRLGVVFRDRPYLYLDVAMRRFFTETTLCNGAVARKVFEARRSSCKEGFRYETDRGLSRMFHRRYIRDIYYASIFSPELFCQVLY